MLFVGNDQARQTKDRASLRFFFNLTLVVSLLFSSGCYSRMAGQDKEIKTVKTPPKKLVTIEGTAQNAKISAVVVSPEGVVYCLNFREWPSHVVGKRIRVKGVLETTDEFAAKTNSQGEITQGSAGGDLVMRQCDYQLID